MASKCAKILLTGLPGCGKTTAVMRIVADLGCENVKGFYTQEIRESGIRKGFCWKRLDGIEGILSHIDIMGCCRVGKYGVDVAGFERLVVPVLEAGRSGSGLFIIDEIGKMECLSEKFVGAVRRLFASDVSILATVAQKGSGLISEVKGYEGTKLFNLTPANRDKIVTEVLRNLSYLKKGL
jgi:nucleoside-triphosphatase